MNFAERLDGCADFECVFGLVKSAVEATTGRRRAGLILGLMNLSLYVGAFHQLGSNFIIMNKTLVEMVLSTGNRKLVNAYIFHILLHEYIHSLGFVNEEQTQMLTYSICEKVLGTRHPATMIARYGIGAVLPEMSAHDYNYELESDRANWIDIVKDFESDNLDYFG